MYIYAFDKCFMNNNLCCSASTYPLNCYGRPLVLVFLVCAFHLSAIMVSWGELSDATGYIPLMVSWFSISVQESAPKHSVCHSLLSSAFQIFHLLFAAGSQTVLTGSQAVLVGSQAVLVETKTANNNSFQRFRQSLKKIISSSNFVKCRLLFAYANRSLQMQSILSKCKQFCLKTILPDFFSVWQSFSSFMNAKCLFSAFVTGFNGVEDAGILANVILVIAGIWRTKHRQYTCLLILCFFIVYWGTW